METQNSYLKAFTENDILQALGLADPDSKLTLQRMIKPDFYKLLNSIMKNRF